MKYTGEITAHYEQGCGNWPQFHDYRGRHGDKLQFWNWDYTINFNNKTKIKHLKIWDEKDKVIYDGPWTYSRKNTAEARFACPKEMEPFNWIVCIGSQHRKCEIETDEILKALAKPNLTEDETKKEE